ncbi:hypothetical protein K8I28_02370 [bacterium]|nr:hypothetical protein [bacterium]
MLDKLSGNLLHLAVKLSAKECIQPLVEFGVDLNKLNADNEPPVYRAIVDDIDGFKELWKCGALALCNIGFESKENILDLAIRHGRFTKYDIERLNQHDENGMLPLSHAVLENDLKRVHFLLSWGANPNIPDYSGMSPLDYAIELKYDEVRELLEEYRPLELWLN